MGRIKRRQKGTRKRVYRRSACIRNYAAANLIFQPAAASTGNFRVDDGTVHRPRPSIEKDADEARRRGRETEKYIRHRNVSKDKIVDREIMVRPQSEILDALVHHCRRVASRRNAISRISFSEVTRARLLQTSDWKNLDVQGNNFASLADCSRGRGAISRAIYAFKFAHAKSKYSAHGHRDADDRDQARWRGYLHIESHGVTIFTPTAHVPSQLTETMQAGNDYYIAPRHLRRVPQSRLTQCVARDTKQI